MGTAQGKLKINIVEFAGPWTREAALTMKLPEKKILGQKEWDFDRFGQKVNKGDVQAFYRDGWVPVNKDGLVPVDRPTPAHAEYRNQQLQESGAMYDDNSYEEGFKAGYEAAFRKSGYH